MDNEKEGYDGICRRITKNSWSSPLILVGAVVLVINENGDVLLQKNRAVWKMGAWGLMELSESPEETACREVYEETE